MIPISRARQLWSPVAVRRRGVRRAVARAGVSRSSRARGLAGCRLRPLRLDRDRADAWAPRVFLFKTGTGRPAAVESGRRSVAGSGWPRCCLTMGPPPQFARARPCAGTAIRYRVHLRQHRGPRHWRPSRRPASCWLKRSLLRPEPRSRACLWGHDPSRPCLRPGGPSTSRTPSPPPRSAGRWRCGRLSSTTPCCVRAW